MSISKELENAILNASAGEINQIIGLIKDWQQAQTRKASKTFNVGDRVHFDARTHGIIRGYVTKVNSKTVKVRAMDDKIWNVEASLLRKF